MFNQALLAKIAWRIINVPDSLLARILIGKYCHKKNFLEVDLPKVCSHGWRGVLQGRNLLRENLGKAIGNGMTTSVWKDSWMSLDEQLKFCGPVQEEALDLKVSDLLTDEMKWNTERIEKFVPEFKEKILSLQPSKQELKTVLYGTLSPQVSTLQDQDITLLHPTVKREIHHLLQVTSTGSKMYGRYLVLLR